MHIQAIKSRRVVFKDWYKTTFPLNRIIKNPILHLRNGGVLAIQNIFSKEVLWATDYFIHKDEYRFSDIILPPNAVIFDLGANMGFVTLDMHLRYPTAHITSYEPHPDTFKILKGNAPFATLVQKAVGTQNGLMSFDTTGSSSTYHLSPTGDMEVEVVTLDKVLKDVAKVDLLKIDIEGGELAMLAAASPETLAKIDRIVLEAQGTEVVGTATANGLTYTKYNSINKEVEEALTGYGFTVQTLEDYGVFYACRPVS